MRITYDPQADVLCILLNDSATEASDGKQSGIILDYDRDGKLVRLEVFEASRRIPSPQSVEYTVVPVAPHRATQTYTGMECL